MKNEPMERLIGAFAAGRFDVKADEIFQKRADAEDRQDITILPAEQYFTPSPAPEPRMTKRGLLEILRRCNEINDAERAHTNADAALLAFIGDEEITEAFNEVERWYA